MEVLLTFSKKRSGRVPFPIYVFCYADNLYFFVFSSFPVDMTKFERLQMNFVPMSFAFQENGAQKGDLLHGIIK